MTTLARATSILLHPVVTVALAVVLSRPRGDSATSLLAIAVLVAIPLLGFIWTQARGGAWENVDASRSEERHSLYAVAALIVIATGLWFHFTGAATLVRGTIAVGVMMAVAYATLRWIKLSLHLAFGAYATGILLHARPAIGIVLLVLLPLLAWSRLYLKRHSIAEVIGGTMLGALTAAVVVFAL